MKRLFWTAMGVTVGVLVTRRAARAMDALTPEGMTDRLTTSITNLGDAVREFGQDVRDAMWDREDELYEALGLHDAPEETPTPRR
jgi:Family of unknown function (DUF6167)